MQAYIRGRRLEAVRLALADPAAREPIYTLAERFGFSDAAHLSRLFRARYGLTPSDTAPAGGTADPPETGQAIRFETWVQAGGTPRPTPSPR